MKSQKRYNLKKKRKCREADKLWQQAIFKKYGEFCEVCGKPSGPPHHFVPKSLSAALRYDLKNGVPLCTGCHFAHHHKSDPEIHARIIEKRGQKWYNYLQEHRRDSVITSLAYFEDKIKKLSGR